MLFALAVEKTILSSQPFELLFPLFYVCSIEIRLYSVLAGPNFQYKVAPVNGALIK